MRFIAICFIFWLCVVGMVTCVHAANPAFTDFSAQFKTNGLKLNLQTNAQIVWVDPAGSDTTGTRGDPFRPFKTLRVGAVNAAQFGDTIHVLQGTYNGESNLLKNGVNWELDPGVVVGNTTNPGNGAVWGIWDDRQVGAITCNIAGAGAGIYYYSYTNKQCVGAIVVTNPASRITARLGYVSFDAHPSLIPNVQLDSSYAGIHIEQCQFVSIDVDEVNDPFVNDSATDHNCSGIVWYNGECHIKVKHVAKFQNSGSAASQYGIWAVQNGPLLPGSNDLFIAADRVESHCYINGGTNTQWRTWWNPIGYLEAGISCHDGGKHYINCQKIAHGTFSAALEISDGNGEWWINGQKIEANKVNFGCVNFSDASTLAPGGPATVHLTVAHYDDTQTSHTTAGTVAGALINNESGTGRLYIHGGLMTPRNRVGIAHGGLGTIVQNAIILVQTNNSENYPVWLEDSSSGMEMYNCKINAGTNIQYAVTTDPGAIDNGSITLVNCFANTNANTGNTTILNPFSVWLGVGNAIQTNWVTGQLYTNNTASDWFVRASAKVTTAAVTGDAAIRLETGAQGSSRTTLSAVELQTTVAVTIAMVYTNEISGYIPAGNVFTFTNRSNGAGNTAVLNTGTGQQKQF